MFRETFLNCCCGTNRAHSNIKNFIISLTKLILGTEFYNAVCWRSVPFDNMWTFRCLVFIVHEAYFEDSKWQIFRNVTFKKRQNYSEGEKGFSLQWTESFLFSLLCPSEHSVSLGFSPYVTGKRRRKLICVTIRLYSIHQSPAATWALARFCPPPCQGPK